MVTPRTTHALPKAVVISRLREKSILNGMTGCMEWQGAKHRDGYGIMFVGTRRWWLTHRLAWDATRGQIPEGLHVLHRCDNPCCINIDHLFVGNHADNQADKVRKGRAFTGNHAGEAHSQARLTAASVRSIRSLRASGLELKVIAAMYGVTFQTVSDISRRKRWRHLE